MNSQLHNYIIFPPNRVWRTYIGGKTLDLIDGKSKGHDTHMAEDWIASTTRAINPDRDNLISEGLSPIAIDNFETLSDYIESDPEGVLGNNHLKLFGKDMGVLIKLLDSGLRLHLQCHPDRDFSREFLGVNAGKTECYIVLSIRDTVKDPYVYFGFQNAPDESTFKQVVEAQDMDELLSWFEPLPVKPGDMLIVPGGIPHAIGEGIFMIEVMEPTDLTVRFEFEREGIVLPESARYMGRDIDFAASMIDFKSYSHEEIRKQFFIDKSPIVEDDRISFESCVDSRQTDCFSVRQLRIKSGEKCRVSSESFYTGVVTEGHGSIRADESSDPLEQFSRFFVPHSTDEVELHAEADLTLTFIYPPAAGETYVESE